MKGVNTTVIAPRSDNCDWHLADIPTAPVLVRHWHKADIPTALLRAQLDHKHGALHRDVA